MIEQAINRIVDLAVRTRQSQILLEDGTERIAIYDDAEHRYEIQERVLRRDMTVSNVVSFAHLINDILRREENPTGDGATVVLTQAGGYFRPEDGTLDSLTFTRTLDPQWLAFAGALGRPYDHRGFLRILQGLRPSIFAYDDVMRHFRKVHFGSNVSISSAPTLVDGKQGNEYAVEFTAKGGQTGSTALPSEIELSLPYFRALPNRYNVTAEIDLHFNEQAKSVTFTLVSPDLALAAEQAIKEEVEILRGMTTTAKHLLVLLNL